MRRGYADVLSQFSICRFGDLKYMFHDATVLGICTYKNDGSPPAVHLSPQHEYQVSYTNTSVPCL